MLEKVTLNADEASKLVRKIQESTEEIVKGSRELQDNFKVAHDKSDINFLAAIAQGMENICNLGVVLNNTATNLQTGLTKYIGEVADYSSDTTGLFR